MANTTTFKSLTHEQPAYDSKRGKEFRANVQGFAAKDAEVRQAGNRYVVGTFTNLSGSKEVLDNGLGLSIEEQSYEGKNGTLYSIPANFNIWFNTQAEAESVAATLTKGANFSAPVRVYAREYNDKIYIEMDMDGLFVREGSGGSNGAPAVSAKANSDAVSKAIENDDLPF